MGKQSVITRKYQVVAYMPSNVYEAMKKYLEDLEKQNPGLEANVSKYVVNLVREDLIKRGYLKE